MPTSRFLNLWSYMQFERNLLGWYSEYYHIVLILFYIVSGDL